ncbi:MAG: hypothetical protein ACI8U4_002740 [Natronomonas sp.]|jgi:hypothetical protein
MYQPPLDPRPDSVATAPTWRALLVRYAVVAAVPILLWAISQPVTAVLALGAIAALSIGARRGYGLVRCFYDCQAMIFDLGGVARITVRQTPTDDQCCPR